MLSQWLNSFRFFQACNAQEQKCRSDFFPLLLPLCLKKKKKKILTCICNDLLALFLRQDLSQGCPAIYNQLWCIIMQKNTFLPTLAATAHLQIWRSGSENYSKRFLFFLIYNICCQYMYLLECLGQILQLHATWFYGELWTTVPKLSTILFLI